MEDIATIQKINTMSRELKKFGFFDTREDSVNGASQMFMTDEQKQNSRIFGGENTNAYEELASNFRRYKDATDKKLLSLSNELMTLNSRIKELSERPVARNETPKIIRADEQVSRSAPMQSAEQPKQEPAKESKPYYEKQGRFTPDDVKIDEIFYFGNK